MFSENCPTLSYDNRNFCLLSCTFVVQIKARKTCCNVESSALQKKKILRVETPTVAAVNTLQSRIEDVDDFIDEDTLLTAEDLSRTELPLGVHFQT